MSFTPFKSPITPPQIELPKFVLPAVLPDNVAELTALLQAQQARIGAIEQQAMQAMQDAIQIATHPV